MSPRPGGPQPFARLSLDPAAQAAFAGALGRCEAEAVGRRLRARDHTLWKPASDGIADRLGWLGAPAAMRAQLEPVAAFADGVRAEGFSDVLLLGMGGSSLAPELFASTFGSAPGRPRLSVLDSTDPVAVRGAAERCPPERTLYLVSTKSGGTVETLSFFKFFHALAVERLGTAGAGRHFAAITDPGSSLEAAARSIGARAVFLNDPDVGGRFSALTLFGLVPAALCGVDVGRLLDGAVAMAEACAVAAPPGENPGLALGALAGALALAGRNKLRVVCSGPIAGFGAWAEQLIAESTGKEGRGIVPVDGGPPAADEGGGDHLFVFLLLEGDRSCDTALASLAAAGRPVAELRLADPYGLGGELFRWEVATAVLGHFLGVNPFDQPDVESAKLEAGRALAAYRAEGSLPAPSREVDAAAAAGELQRLLDAAAPGGYVAVQAFVEPRGSGAALHELVAALRARTGLAVTLGFGPRFLHSTGQLHKGGPPGGLFLQLVSTGGAEVTIPDDFGSGAGRVGFGVLKRAQSLGDLRALEAAGRRVLRVNLGEEGPGVAERVRGLARAAAGRA